MEHAASPLAAWESFYVIVGSSAAALTGLQFVVIVLGAEVRALVDETTRAFATPTIVHFCSVLLISAIVSAPWTGLGSAGLCLGLWGIAGLVYAALMGTWILHVTVRGPIFFARLRQCLSPAHDGANPRPSEPTGSLRRDAGC